MAGGGGGARGQVTSEPNVIPMIDIMLVLLIIFMISQPLETAAVANPNSNQIVLELTADGGYQINSQPVPKDQLDQQIHNIFDTRPAKLMFIKAAPDRIYQDLIEAMDVSRGAGVQVIGFTPKAG